jgi:hypothetical protein
MPVPGNPPSPEACSAPCRFSNRRLPWLAWLALASAAEAGYLGWSRAAASGAPYGAQLAVFLFLHLPPLLGFAVARARPPRRADWFWIVGAAALFRLTLLASPPVLSDDLYRYLWDGRVQTHGINPYLHAPDDPALAHLRDPLHARINHSDVPTIYPPLSQILFAAVSYLSGSVTAMKAAMALAEMVGWLALGRLWILRGLPASWLVLYLWNPLPVIEVSGSGHNDAPGVTLLLFASLLIILGRPGVSIATLAGSVASKLFPFLSLPAWLRATPRRFWILPLLLWAALWAPYAGAGWELWSGLGAYTRHWESNAFVFRYLREGIEGLGLKGEIDEIWGKLCLRLGRGEWAASIWPYSEPRQVAKGVVALTLLAVLIDTLRRRLEPPRAAFRLLGLALVCGPTVHPWYLQWVLPFAAWYASPSWFVFSAASFLAYAPAGWGGVPADVLLWIEYAPFLAVWAGEALFSARSSRAAQPHRMCR